MAHRHRGRYAARCNFLDRMEHKVRLLGEDCRDGFHSADRGFCVLLLFKLQDSMKRARLALNPQDPTPWLRGADVLCLLASVTLLAAIVVLYFLWATHAASKSC